ncbi:MAG TPA: RNA pseudouridine synthase [bacterium]|nr:RNA pseudouridine synthase [bacterium]
MNIQIIKETSDYLIINKPANLIVHGGSGITEKTLVDYLIEKYPKLQKVGEDPLRPGIVHRLDKEASGLMIIAKNNIAFNYFKNQFKDRKITKEYIALVSGKLDKDEGLIDFPINRSSQGYKMAAIPSTIKNLDKLEKLDDDQISNRTKGHIKALNKSRSAITKFWVIKKLINFTLIKINIKTGRTHQIRVHFSAFGHPLLGDNLYGNKKSKIQNKKLNINRIFLMANHLNFVDLNGETQDIIIDLDLDLKEILNKVK